MRQPVTRRDVFATGESTRYPMTSPSDEVFNGAAAWAEVAELNQRLYDAREALERISTVPTPTPPPRRGIDDRYRELHALEQVIRIAREALHPTQNEGAP